MDLVISLDGPGEKTARVYRALRAAIADGRLPAGQRLPPTRALAADLGVARGSVATAYERLAAEGYLVARVGRGTFVAELPVASTPRPATAGELRPRTGWELLPLPVSGDDAKPRYDFRTGIPDAGLFPFDTWRRLVSAEVRLRANSPGTYADPAGHPALRAAIARYLGVARSIPVAAADVVVTNGTQQALDLIARVLLRPGDVVAVEEPGYPPARRLFASFGARVAGVPVDDEGLVADALPAAARLVYVTPSHQFPLGRPMSLARRHALVDWARRRRAAVVEDDYDSEFRFSARPLEPLHTLAPGRVLHVGTFSKTMLPTVRSGFVLTPPSLRPALVAARQVTDGFGPTAVQAALARFIDDGVLARHVRHATKAYAARHAAITGHLAALSEVDLVPSAAGLHVTALLRAGASGPVVAAGRRAGLALDDLATYYSAAQTAGFVFGFGAVSADTIDDGMALFARLLRSAG